jgi:hypothetical protein
VFLAFGPINLLFKFQVLQYPLCTISALLQMILEWLVPGNEKQTNEVPKNKTTSG